MENLFELVAHYALPFVAVISVVVFVHEFGHYWVARRCGIKIETFSIGFGHEIFGWTDKRGTRWKVSWLPLGGYVKMFGDANAASAPDAKVHDMQEEERKVSFFHQAVGKRMAVIVAGPLANYIFAIVALALLFMLHGQPYTQPEVSSIMPKSAAEAAGIKAGDRIVKLDGTRIDRFEDIKFIVLLNTGTPMEMDILRDGKLIKINVTPKIETKTDNFGVVHKANLIGIVSSKLDYKIQPPVEALRQATIQTWDLTTSTLKAMGQMIQGTRNTDDVGGPLRIAEISGTVAKEGPWAMVFLMAMISINLGLINLFPIPMLDGGHLVFYLAEFFRGKPLSLRVQEAGFNIGTAMVVFVMLFATWNDLVHIGILSLIKRLFS